MAGVLTEILLQRAACAIQEGIEFHGLAACGREQSSHLTRFELRGHDPFFLLKFVFGDKTEHARAISTSTDIQRVLDLARRKGRCAPAT